MTGATTSLLLCRRPSPMVSCWCRADKFEPHEIYDDSLATRLENFRVLDFLSRWRPRLSSCQSQLWFGCSQQWLFFFFFLFFSFFWFFFPTPLSPAGNSICFFFHFFFGNRERDPVRSGKSRQSVKRVRLLLWRRPRPSPPSAASSFGHRSTRQQRFLRRQAAGPWWLRGSWAPSTAR